MGTKRSGSLVERWLPVVGFEGRYEVSSLGRVRSLGAQSKWSRWRHYKGAVISGCVLKHGRRVGYRQFCLRKDGVETNHSGHVLVAAAFLGPRPDGMMVCHNDGNGLDNRVSNLRYDSAASNTADAKKQGTIRTRASGHPNAKLTVSQVEKIVLSPLASSELARQYGVSHRTVNHLRKNAKGRYVLREVDVS